VPQEAQGNRNHDEQLVAVWTSTLVGEGVEITTAGLIAALNSPRLHIRAGAAILLGRLGAVSATASLRPLLEDQSATVRVEAAMSLALLGDKTGVPVLIAALEEDLLTGAPITAASYLAALGDPRGYKVVLEALQSKLAGVRLNGAIALKSFVPYHGKEAGGEKIDLLAILKKELNDPDPMVRQELLYKLAMIDEKNGTDILSRIARSDSDEHVRQTAQQLLSAKSEIGQSKRSGAKP
jgi:HEAT repeat protein